MSVQMLTAENIRDHHPEVPDDFRTTMGAIRNRGGPWPCDGCSRGSLLCYRCSRCGADLAGEGSTSGQGQQ